MYRKDEYKIISSDRGYVVVNENGKYKNHSHFKYSFKAAKKCIELVSKHKIPRYSRYMMIACKRISLDGKYIEQIDNILRKEEKQGYINRGNLK